VSTTSPFQRALTRAARILPEHPEYGVRPAQLRRLRAQDPTTLHGPDAAAAFVACGVALQKAPDLFPTGSESHAALCVVLQGLRERAQFSDAAQRIPPFYRAVDYWTGQLRARGPVADAGMEALLTDPRLADTWRAVENIWHAYQRDALPAMRAELARIADVYGRVPLTDLQDMNDAWQALGRMTSIRTSYGGKMSTLLQTALTTHDAWLSEAQKNTLGQIWRFLGHDISNMIRPALIWGSMVRGDTNGRCVRVLAPLVHALLDPAGHESLLQLLSFPLGIIPTLVQISQLRASVQTICVGRVARLSGLLVFFRVATEYLHPRLLLQREGVQPELQIVTAGADAMHISADAEGFFFGGDLDSSVEGYVDPVCSVLYNLPKNAGLAMGVRYFQEDSPESAASRVEWRARQETRIYQTRIRYQMTVGEGALGFSRPPVQWVAMRDSAGGFPLNTIFNRAIGLLRQHLDTILGHADLARLRALTQTDRLWVIEHLQQALGVRDRMLVERLFDSLLYPRKASWNVPDILAMANIFRLSGAEVHDGGAHSGFGLFGSHAIAPTADLSMFTYLDPAPRAPGTETIVALQSRNGLRYSEAELRSFVESSGA